MCLGNLNMLVKCFCQPCLDSTFRKRNFEAILDITGAAGLGLGHAQQSVTAGNATLHCLCGPLALGCRWRWQGLVLPALSPGL